MFSLQRYYMTIEDVTLTACKKQQSHHSTSSRVILFLFFARRCDVICGQLEYTHTHTGKCNLFVKWKSVIDTQPGAGCTKPG